MDLGRNGRGPWKTARDKGDKAVGENRDKMGFPQVPRVRGGRNCVIPRGMIRRMDGGIGCVDFSPPGLLGESSPLSPVFHRPPIR
jgi:hypothetical protein